MYRITDIGTYDYIVEEAPKFYKDVDGERVECERWDAEYVDTKQWSTRRVWRGTDLNAEDSEGKVVIVQDPGILTRIARTGEQHTTQMGELDTGAQDLGDAVADIADGTLDLADAIDAMGTDLAAALVEMADIVAAQEERLAALDAAQKGE